jgi:hypothetical protein
MKKACVCVCVCEREREREDDDEEKVRCLTIRPQGTIRYDKELWCGVCEE